MDAEHNKQLAEAYATLQQRVENLERIRFERDAGTTHWEGCWREHYKCAIRRIEELEERNRMLSDISLSALALKLNLEHGATKPSLHALERDLDAFQRRFGNTAEQGADDAGRNRPA